MFKLPRLARNAAQLPAPPPRFHPEVEAFEKREFLTGGFLQGTVFLDGNGNNQFDPLEQMAGATVTLSGASLAAPVSKITSADGKFFFGGLAPGDYTLVQTPPAGYVPS